MKALIGSDTIFAIASGAGRSAVAILRISGSEAAVIARAIAGELPPARQAKLVSFKNPASGEILDRGLLLFFPGPASFTGEDCVEFHLHGSRAGVSAMLKVLGGFAHARPAEPGEFTRRAFLNGKMDLAEVEGLADLLDAETEWQRRQAFHQASGGLSAKAKVWRDEIITAAALIEASIDFAEEEDVPAEIRAEITTRLSLVRNALAAELAHASRGERIREGLTVVIAGPPNAGKSTLLNLLARREVAIVSPFAGTTRDLLEVHLDLDGCPVNLIDTAGLRENAETVEEIGIARARARAQEADLILWLSEAAVPLAPPEDLKTGKIWRIFSKSDQLAKLVDGSGDKLWISAATGANIDALLERLAQFAQATLGDGFAGLITRERHRRAFESAVTALERVIGGRDTAIELLAEDLRLGAQALASIIGTIGVEDLLDEIFARFCIGK